MRVKIEKTSNGELFFRIPDEYQAELKWQESDIIQWIDNQNGSYTLRKRTRLDELKEKAFSDPECKKEYDRVCYGITKLMDAGFDEKQAAAIVFVMEDIHEANLSR